MPMQWGLSKPRGVTVLSIWGFLTAQDVDRLNDAATWTWAKSSGPLVLDLTGLQGWAAVGEAALGATARQWTSERRAVVLCLAPTSLLTIADAELAACPRYPGISAAVSAVNRREATAESGPGCSDT